MSIVKYGSWMRVVDWLSLCALPVALSVLDVESVSAVVQEWCACGMRRGRLVRCTR